MKEDISILIVNKLTMLVALIAGIIGVVKVANDLSKAKTDRDIQVAKEQSAGATAIAHIKSEMEIMKTLISENKVSQDQIKHIVEQLETNYSKLLDKFVEFFKK